MKKALFLFVVLCVLLSSVACAAELTPLEKCRQKVVSIGEAYLDFEITAAEAHEQLESIKVPETEGSGQLSLEVDKDFLAFLIAKQDSNYDDIKDKVDWIRKYKYE